MLNLCALLEDSARRYADRPAFTSENKTLSFGQVNDAANQVAALLTTLDVSPGDKVCICIPNIPEFPIIYYGILKAGAIVVPLSTMLRKDELAYYLTDSEAKIFISFCGTDDSPIGKQAYDAFRECGSCDFFFLVGKTLAVAGAEDVPYIDDVLKNHKEHFETTQTRADDTAVIVYTSGTTGAARGAELSHANLFINAVVSSDILQSGHSDVQLMVLPLFHIFGMTVMMNAGLYKGVHSVMLSKFEAGEVLRLMQAYSVSIFAGVPTMYWSLLNQGPHDFDYRNVADKLRICISGGASLAIEILSQFEEKFSVPILEGYGMSEGSPVVTFNQLETGRRPGSIGTPVWGVEVKVVDAGGQEVPAGVKGELCYRGHNVMKSYYKKPADTKVVLKNGWLHSGDVAIKDEDGFYFIVDRIKDIIIRGGITVYPREIEEVLMQHPAISLSSVIGVPNEKWGEEIKA
ncbi:MAG TPA: AMP-binding protein, partial [Puia sp.]|nr:AMP-binding protein [Puia sp.]